MQKGIVMAVRNVGILIFDDVEVLDFAGPYEVFQVTSELIEPTPFNTYTIAMNDQPVLARGGLSINPDYTLNTCPSPDILIVPGGWGSRKIVENEEVISWILAQYDQLELLLSVCTGSLVLGRAKLLDGLQATTHHTAFDRLQQESETITIIENQRFVDQGKIITSGGISAGIDMSLYVVKKLLGDNVDKTLAEMEWMWHQEAT